MRDGPNLVAALERAIRKPGDDWGQKNLHVSDLAVAIEGLDGKCSRQVWLRVHGAESRPAHAGEQMMWEAGHRLHRAVVEWLEKGLRDGWRIVGLEVDLTDRLPVGLRGRCDVILVGPNGERVIVDMKTQRGASFKWMGDGDAKPAHVLQLQAYMMAAGADYGIVLYLDREGQSFCKQRFVERDDARVIDAWGELKALPELVEAPPVLEPVTKKGKLAEPWQCDYCNLRGVSCPGAIADYEERTLNAQLVASIEALQ